ncbi:MAG: zf-HC2 domain-containing protein [Spirochaetes bacterium]|uniref:Zf-HC2 domain-containing protein n=1 Tax=Candidatus Avitreponema avistercoris TaxID=2840705 RepID=A0A9D9EMB3_9SPIR|nr:zf-HC2 domain-containing protein [Candidatus Avitreponema avistercoris]
MSTCPDKSLYSAYVDGEVPSPWKEKLEAHLAACETCRAVESRYRNLRSAVQDSGVRLPENQSAFLENSFRSLSAHWALASSGTKSVHRTSRWDGGRKWISMPYAALAAMLLVAAFIPSFFAVRTMESRFTASASPQPASAADTGSQIVIAGLQAQEPRNTPHAAAVYGGYNPDVRLPENGVRAVSVSGGNPAAGFTLLDRTRMFSQDKEMLPPAGQGYVIIRLPQMVNFSPETNPGKSPMHRPGHAPQPRHAAGR